MMKLIIPLVAVLFSGGVAFSEMTQPPSTSDAAALLSNIVQIVAELPFRIPRLIKEAKILHAYGLAWNETNGNNAKDIASFFDEKGIYYSDLLRTPVVLAQKVQSNDELQAYLEKVFKRFPKQVWAKNVRIYPDIFHVGEWAYYYEFEMYDRIEDAKPSFTGTGMERVTFNENGKLRSDEVHLIINEVDSYKDLGVERD